MRPINPKTLPLAQKLVTLALTAKDLNPAFEAFGYCFFLFGKLIAKDAKVALAELLVQTLGHVEATVDQTNLRVAPTPILDTRLGKSKKHSEDCRWLEYGECTCTPKEGG
jgi:hypothetical protein